MKNKCESFVRRALRDQRGQVLPWVIFGMIGLLGMAGISVDVGKAYAVRNQLQSAVNAAALAGAAEVYNTSSTNNATTIATTYLGLNNNTGLTAVSGYPKVTTLCLNALMPSGTTCGSSTPANALRVTAAVQVPTSIIAILGLHTLTVAATATSSMQGAAQPWNVAIVLDATASMSNAPPAGSCTGYSTEFACALGGVQDLLEQVNPCGGISSCTTTNAKVRISLFSFPNVTTASVADDYTCSGTPTNEQYTLPLTTLTASTGYVPLAYGSNPTSTYQDVPFAADWYSATSSNFLNSTSHLVKAVGGCMKNPGGESTYYASVIYAAQAALLAQQAAETTAGFATQNAMIILSDGQAQAANTKFPSTGTAASPSADGYSIVTNSTSNTKNLVNGTKGHYPDFNDECQQAIQAAQDAQSAGTTVYSVAFSSESTGCTSSSGGTDSTLWATATSGQPALSLSTLTPCIVMKNMASPASSTGTTYFYADTSSSTSGCTDTAHTVQSIQDIFGAIAATFTTPRLVPNGTT
jgi:Flp pilus assembly protein TadG